MLNPAYLRLIAMLSRITMYRLMLYYLLVLILGAISFSAAGILPYDPLQIATSTLLLIVICALTNLFLSKLYKASVNVESPLITALIMSLILGPFDPYLNLGTVVLAGTGSMASKYVLALKKRHIFNPATVGVVLTALILGRGASWWIGDPWLLPLVLTGGLVMTLKIRRYHLVGSFLAVYAIGVILLGLTSGLSGNELARQLRSLSLFSPILFFSFVMLVEPMTSPPTRRLRLIYGLFVAAALLIYQSLLLGIGYTLELALLSGNILARLMHSESLWRLKLAQRQKLGPNITAFHFDPDNPLKYQPGQFLEWTLPHPRSDNRGTRRFFTISSSPTEPDIMLTTKFNPKSSTFKTALAKMKPGGNITATRPDGEFTLPVDPKQPLVFIAGGIGITPFRSMTKFLLDQKQPRNIVLLYGARSSEELVFKDLFDQAAKEIKLKNVYVLSEKTPSGWRGRKGLIDERLIKSEVPDWQRRLFYVSGPEPMVIAFEKMLIKMGLSKKQIKRDEFPGYTE